MGLYWKGETGTITQGSCLPQLKRLADESVNCCVTSPPYFGLRDYQVEGQLGLEETPADYVHNLVIVFQEVWRVLRKDGTLWLVIGDSYVGYKGNNYCRNLSSSNLQSKSPVPKSHNVGTPHTCQGMKNKDLIGIPWMVAFALRDDGWYLRQDIVWHKTNPMPESVKDRCTRSHELIFLLSKSPRYYYDNEAVKELAVNKKTYGTNMSDTSNSYGCGNGGNLGLQDFRRRTKREGLPTKRNRHSVWTLPTKPYKGAHFATFPPDLIRPCILAGCPEGGTVLDPFFGAGTVGVVCQEEGRRFIGVELNADYCELAKQRIMKEK